MKVSQTVSLVFYSGALFLCPLLGSTNGQDNASGKEKGEKEKISTSKEETKKHETAVKPVGSYLGIAVEALHPAFHRHLPDSLIEGQGVMVASISKDSPADKAGMKTHDILTSFDDQKLFSGDQLVKLVRAAKPGQEVKFHFVRSGKLESLSVKLGEAPQHLTVHDHQYRDFWERRFPLVPFSPLRPDSRIKEHSGGNKWKSFHSLSLKKLDGNRYRAEVSYFDKDGKTQTHVFEGTREEIHKQIQDAKDLPEEERDQLLDGLEMHPHFGFPSGFPFEWPDPLGDF